MEKIRAFLLSPDENKDEFEESDALIWIDWGEYDEDIIGYFNERLPDEAKIDFEYMEIEKERGIDIILNKNGVKMPIPYAEDCMDRDTTLKSIQEYVSPDYQIRWYMGSLGSDTLAFCIGSVSQWNQLEQEFGAEKVTYYFAPIQENNKMFKLNMEEVYDLIEEREKA